MSQVELRVFPTVEETVAQLQQVLSDRLVASAQAGQTFWLSLAGGSTPKVLYGRWAEQALPWQNLGLIWGDERFVSHQHADSNYRMVRENFLDVVGSQIPSEQVVAWPEPGGSDAAAANECAKQYGLAMRALFAQRPCNLALLGMGDDGHTASLFPGTEALNETHHWAVANWVEKFSSHRLTLTYPFFEQCQEVIFLVTGAGKQTALRQVIKQGQHPSSRIRCQGTVTFYCDQAAAQLLD